MVTPAEVEKTFFVRVLMQFMCVCVSLCWVNRWVSLCFLFCGQQQSDFSPGFHDSGRENEAHFSFCLCWILLPSVNCLRLKSRHDPNQADSCETPLTSDPYRRLPLLHQVLTLITCLKPGESLAFVVESRSC